MPSPVNESRGPLSSDVHELIARHLRSATEIEVLLLLYRSAETFWTASAAASFVGAAQQEVQAHLGRFTGAGLVERGRQTDAFRFAPSTEEDRIAVAALAEAYAERPDDVLGAVTGSLSQITAFSDAFRFPRKPGSPG